MRFIVKNKIKTAITWASFPNLQDSWHKIQVGKKFLLPPPWKRAGRALSWSEFVQVTFPEYITKIREIVIVSGLYQSGPAPGTGQRSLWMTTHGCSPVVAVMLDRPVTVSTIHLVTLFPGPLLFPPCSRLNRNPQRCPGPSHWNTWMTNPWTLYGKSDFADVIT